MLNFCMRYGASIVVGTDAHFATAVGRMSEASELLEEVHFPEELVANTSVETYLSFLHKYR